MGLSIVSLYKIIYKGPLYFDIPDVIVGIIMWLGMSVA
jgi:hypothetical protein